MDRTLHPGNVLRFGVFELDTSSGELRKSGVKIRTADQAIKILHRLLTRQGEVVTREELVAVLWPDGTNVDFENGLNAAVKKLRIALSDSGASPRYIETLPRKGYRLIVPVNPLAASQRVPIAADEPSGRRYRYPQSVWRAALVALTLAAGSVAVYWYWSVQDSTAPQAHSGAGWGRPSNVAEANEYFDKAELFLGFGLLDPVRASGLLERAIQLDPRFGRARAEYGMALLATFTTGRSNDRALLYSAEEQILQGLKDDPTFSYGHAALAGVYIHDGRKDRALSEIEAARKIDPHNPSARHWLAIYHNLSGNVGEARSLFTETLARHPRFFPSQMYLGELARLEGDWEDSIRHLGKLLEYDPQQVFALQFLVRTHMDRGDLPEARRTLARARPADRAALSTRALEAILLVLEGQREEAAKSIDGEVLKYLEMNALWTLAGAEFYSLMGDRPRALEWLGRAVRQGDERAEWFARDPALAAIRGEPRFHQIAASLAARRATEQRGVGSASASGMKSPR